MPFWIFGAILALPARAVWCSALPRLFGAVLAAFGALLATQTLKITRASAGFAVTKGSLGSPLGTFSLSGCSAPFWPFGALPPGSPFSFPLRHALFNYLESPGCYAPSWLFDVLVGHRETR